MSRAVLYHLLDLVVHEVVQLGPGDDPVMVGLTSLLEVLRLHAWRSIEYVEESRHRLLVRRVRPDDHTEERNVAPVELTLELRVGAQVLD